jgi:DNA-binding transcriptional LysR family regulator
VSRHIADLERRMGVQLLNRTTRSVQPTEAGWRFLTACENILVELEQSEQSIARTRSELTGALRIAAPKSFGSLHLGDAIVAFQEAHPRLQIALTLEDYSFRPYDFLAGGLDLAVRLSDMRDSSVIARRIATLEWIVCASPRHLERHRAPATPADLAHQPCLVHMNLDRNDHLWRFTAAKGAATAKSGAAARGTIRARVKPAFQSNSALVLRKAALAGLGVAMLPRYCIAQDLAEGTLVPLLPRYCIPPRPIMVVHPPADPMPLKVRALADFLARWFARRAPSIGADSRMEPVRLNALQQQ